MKERIRFISEWEEGHWSMTELCRRAGVERKTGYKWLKRYQQGGWEALQDQSRAPRHHPNQVIPEVEEEIVQARQSYPHWGPRKLKVWLEREVPEVEWPAASTIGAILGRHGLTVRRKPRKKAPPMSQPLAHAVQPNDVWCTDFKGWFRCGDGARCDPLTISDACSRYLLRCQAVAAANELYVRPLFEATFRENGLPGAIRNDNGAPFASVGIGGLSPLAVWFIKLGIRPERIEPGQPQQNGRHERMHLTLKQETAQPPAANLRAQQRAFDQFRQVYNHERPHEALAWQTPADRYHVSARTYPGRLAEVAYPPEYEVRRVGACGTFRWRSEKVFVGRALSGEPIGLEPVDDGQWRVWFSFHELALFDEARLVIRQPRRQRSRRKHQGGRSGSDHSTPGGGGAANQE